MPVDELRLKIGAEIAYVFDYGDEWRARFTLPEPINGSHAIPRASDRCEAAPPQYQPPDDE